MFKGELVNNRLLIATLFFATAATLSCAGSGGFDKTGYSVVTDAGFARRFPADKWIVGMGESRQGPGDAALQARARVSEQVESQISSQFNSSYRLDSGPADRTGKPDSESQSVRADATIRTAFEHAQIIRVIDDMCSCRGGLCTAIAAMERDQAADIFRKEYSQAMIDFKAAASQVKDNVAVSTNGQAAALRPDSVAAFASAYNSARAAFRRMEISIARSSAVGRPFKIDHEVMAAWTGLKAARAMMLAAISPLVTVQRPVVDQTGNIAHTIIRALSDMGVTAAAADDCSGVVHLLPSCSIDCQRARMGSNCTATVQVSISACRPGSVPADFIIAGERLSGFSLYGQEKAATAARQTVTPAAILDGLRDGLKDFIPLD